MFVYNELYAHEHFPPKTYGRTVGSEIAMTQYSQPTHSNVASPITLFKFSGFRLITLLITLPIIISMKANCTKNCLLMFTEELSSSFTCEHECFSAVWSFLAMRLFSSPDQLLWRHP